MDIKRLLFLFFLLIVSQNLFAQKGKITGIVTDENGEPLPGVNVLIEGTQLGTSTAADGYYLILNIPAGAYTLKASFIGFSTVRIEDVEVNVNLTTEINITLQEEMIEGEEVVVVAQQPIVKKDVSSSIATINKSDLDALPITSVSSIIELQAGIESGLSIRGSGSDEVAFNLNGFTLRSERDNSPFTGISVTSIENVQVQTGGFNAEYGNIRSGLVQVTSKEGNKDRYTVDALVRVTPAQDKTFGQKVNDPNSYWLRPYLDDAVAWTGTTNGAWDSYTQKEYPAFEGWNAVSQGLLADGDPNNDLTPEGAQQLFKWQHRKNMTITEPDYEVDATIGGPVPFISSKLGDLRFSASLRKTRTMYFIPLATDGYEQTTLQGRLTSNIAQGMKLSIDGMYNLQRGTGASQTGGTGFFVTTAGIAGSMDNVSYIDSRIYSSDYWAPSKEKSTNLGIQFTHTLSNTTFYEVKVNNYVTKNSTNPGSFRDTSNVVSIGGNWYDESPYGFYDELSTGIGSGMRMGVGLSTGRDSSKVSVVNASFGITSQLDRFNQFKGGFELVRTHSKINYGSYDKILPSGRTWSKWDETPIRFAAYIQDKLEFEGMIANIGLRMTYSSPNVDWYDFDYFSEAFIPGHYSDLDTLSTHKVDPEIVLQPRLGVSFPITENSKLFFNYGHFVQLPSPENLYLIRVEPFTNTITRIASPENPLPKTVSYELGYEQNLLNTYLIRISGYYKDLNDQPIQVDYIGRQNQSYTMSRPYSYEDIRGLELTFKKQRGKYFWGEVNYTLSVRSTGYFGTLENYEDPQQQRNYDRQTHDNDISRPIPQPFARMQLYFATPKNFGGEYFGMHPFDKWQLSSTVSWRAGSHLTYTGGGSIPGVRNNLKNRDVWSTSLRLSKEITVSNTGNMKFFMDISNVLNTKYLNINNAGFVDGNDYLDYMASLHLPADKLEEINLLNDRVPGHDKPGDYRDPGTDYVPIETTVDLAIINAPNERALYYNTSEGKYYQYESNSDAFVEADKGYVKKVLDKKAYINMPNQRYFNFFNPRSIKFGIRFSF